MPNPGFVPKAGISTVVPYDGRLEDALVAQIAGVILRRGYADLTFEDDLNIGRLPSAPIIKMSTSSNVDKFFETGSIRLGTYESFRTAENVEVRDETEGCFMVVSRNRRETIFIEGQGGFDHFAFCTFIGDPDPNLLARFGYDSCYRVDNPVAFHRAIAHKLGAIDGTAARCVYRDDKVLVAPRPYNENLNVLSARTAQLAGMAKFFIKPRHFEHQQEFRFNWRFERDDLAPQIVNVPDAAKCCTRLY